MTKRPQKNHARDIRLARGLTLQEVAVSIGTTATQISRLEKGLRKLTPDWIEKLSDALGVSTKELVGGVKEEFITSKLIPNEIKDIYEELDREFLIACFEIVHDWWDFSRGNSKKYFGPRQALVNATMLYPMFYELFKKVGLSAELIIAMKQAALHLFTNTLDAEELRVRTGQAPFYDRLAEFVIPDDDPDEAENDEVDEVEPARSPRKDNKAQEK